MQALEIAKYFVGKDQERKIFNNARCGYDVPGQPYIGSLKLNFLIYMVQNMFLAKNESTFFEDTEYAYTNGVVFENVRRNYLKIIRKREEYSELTFGEGLNSLLDWVYAVFANANIGYCIQVMQQDRAWQEANSTFDQIMNPMRYIEDYKDRYASYLEPAEPVEQDP